MGTTLATLRPPAGAKHRRKRLGRGYGSGHGTTAGRGQKGQTARSGAPKGPGFEGGQMPLQRRLPKRGFKNPFRVAYAAVNVGELARLFKAGEVVALAELKVRGLVPRRAVRWKLLAEGELGHSLKVQAQACSAAAQAKVIAVGGTVELPPGRVAVEAQARGGPRDAAVVDAAVVTDGQGAGS
ncbi:MAG: 50S ribosomal protein L15 [Proteobacteria bacterium]|nr:50S ribosomal protein L15 [Pseudomonadota bacterium]